MKTKKIWLNAVVSLAAIGLLVWWMEWSQVKRLATAANGRWLVVGFMICHLDRILMAYKWGVLLKKSGINVANRELILAYYVSGFWGSFLPVSFSDDVIRISWLKNSLGNGSKILSSVVIERALGAVSLAIVALAGITLFSAKVNAGAGVRWFPLIIILFVALSLTVSMGLFTRRGHDVINWVVRFIPHRRIGEVIEKVRMAIWDFRKSPGVLTTFLGLSLLEQLFPIMVIFMVAKAFDINLSFVWAFTGIPIVLALSRLPLPISGKSLGVQEGLFAFVFSFAGISPSAAILMSVSRRILTLLSVLPGAWYTLPKTNREPADRIDVVTPTPINSR